MESLPTDAKARKEIPMATGLVDYFPDALAAIARVSYLGNKQHNGDAPLHWSRHKSTDHADCIMRHLTQRGTKDDDGQLHEAKLAWRALALLQLACEKEQDKQAILDAKDGDCVAVSNPQFHTGQFSFAGDRGSACSSGGGVAIGGAGGAAYPTFFSTGIVGTLLKSLPPQTGKTFYVAGPMRGYPKFNFPAFDKARDLGISLGHKIISPADMDRENGVNENWTGDCTAPENVRKFVDRDAEALLSLRAENGDGIALLPGWNESTGASAEFFIAKWLGLKIIDARTFKPLAWNQDWKLNRLSDLAGEYIRGKGS